MNKNLLKNLIRFSVYFALISVAICYQYGGNRGNNINNNSKNDICNKELCFKGRNIACNNNGALARRCPSNAKMINIGKDQKDLIVHLHNKHRSTVASGQLPGYKPATRMATMIWDDELAKMAELNVKKCNFEHDECYSTNRFRNPGQCLAYEYFSESEGLDINKSITKTIDMWFNEYKNIDMSYVERFRMDHKFKFYGHFLEFVVDRNTHVGCAAIRYTDSSDKLQYPGFVRLTIACNYGSVYSRELPVYDFGISASKCTTGQNPKYPGLCSLKERINPNHYVDFDF